ncbi:MAG: hypothetical protein HYV63_26705 [Candidatus Schekmanbacteria bacterium]|nr:hypothetical protein [Candidatus Schekmanbacteria bacterium]
MRTMRDVFATGWCRRWAACAVLLLGVALLGGAGGGAAGCRDGAPVRLAEFAGSSSVHVRERAGVAFPVYVARVAFDSWHAIQQGKMRTDGSDVRILDATGAAVPATVDAATLGTVETIVRFQVDALRAGEDRTYYLVHGGTAGSIPAPAGSDRESAARSGRTGFGVESWSLLPVEQDGAVRPAFGRAMYRLRIALADSPMDHFTNEAIVIADGLAAQLTRESTLSYDIRGAQRSTLRVSVQGRLTGGAFTWDNPVRAADGTAASWEVDLNDCFVARWCHREIPLGVFAGKTLEQLFVMTNDEPTIQGGGALSFYLDNVQLLPGPEPEVEPGTFGERLARRVAADPVFFACWAAAVLVLAGLYVRSWERAPRWMSLSFRG